MCFSYKTVMSQISLFGPQKCMAQTETYMYTVDLPPEAWTFEWGVAYYVLAAVGGGGGIASH